MGQSHTDCLLSPELSVRVRLRPYRRLSNAATFRFSFAYFSFSRKKKSKLKKGGEGGIFNK